ncbi:hypothetical protein [Bacteroides reticulotermitis]|uniref:hypothetical protein n=1 Tax=Bacteroides reticulotermitis TaxID=1133319 RepID=UPI003A8A1CE9
MAEQTLDIKNFPALSSADDGSFVLVAQSEGAPGKISVALLKAVIASNITAVVTPKIEDGVWFIGDESTGVQAEGLTPTFRKGETGIEWKYTNQPDEAYQTLLTYAEIQDWILEYDKVSDTEYPEINF